MHIGKWRPLPVVIVIVAALALGSQPASAHSQERRLTRVLDQSNGQCTVGADYQNHTFYQIQTWSLEDGWSALGPWAGCANQQARPAGNLRLAGRWYFQGQGPCAPQTPVIGTNNEGFYATNSMAAAGLKWEQTITPRGLWPWCNLGYYSDGYMSMDTWHSVWTYKGQYPQRWISGFMGNATGHDYYTGGY